MTLVLVSLSSGGEISLWESEGNDLGTSLPDRKKKWKEKSGGGGERENLTQPSNTAPESNGEIGDGVRRSCDWKTMQIVHLNSRIREFARIPRHSLQRHMPFRGTLRVLGGHMGTWYLNDKNRNDWAEGPGECAKNSSLFPLSLWWHLRGTETPLWCTGGLRRQLKLQVHHESWDPLAEGHTVSSPVQESKGRALGVWVSSKKWWPVYLGAVSMDCMC